MIFKSVFDSYFLIEKTTTIKFFSTASNMTFNETLTKESEGTDFVIPKPVNIESDYVVKHCLDTITVDNEFMKKNKHQKNNVIAVQGLPSSRKTTFVGNLIYHYIADYDQLIIFTNSLDHKLTYKKLVEYVIKHNRKIETSTEECMPMFKDKKTFSAALELLTKKWDEDFKTKEPAKVQKEQTTPRVWEKDENMVSKRMSKNQEDFFKMKDFNTMLLDEDNDFAVESEPEKQKNESLKKLIVFEMSKMNDVLLKSQEFTHLMCNLKSYDVDVIIVSEDSKTIKSLSVVDFVVFCKTTLADCDVMKKSLFTSSIRNGKLLFELAGHFQKYAKTYLLGKVNGDASRNPDTYKKHSNNTKMQDFDPSVFFSVSFV